MQKKAGIKICAVYYMAALAFLEAFILGANEGRHETAGNIFFFCMFLFLAIGSICFLEYSAYFSQWRRQMSALYLTAALFWDVNFLYGNAVYTAVSMAGIVVLNLSCLLFAAAALNDPKVWDIFGVIRKNPGICCVEILAALLYRQNFGRWFLGDAYTYYSSVAASAGSWDFSLHSLSAFLMGGHTSYAYAALLSIGELLWHEDGNGIRMVSGILYLVTTGAFYAVCQYIFGKKQQKMNVLLAAVFAVSPLVFGISYSVNSDFPLLCFFTLFVYAALYKKRIWQWVFVLAVCFSKETGIVMIAGYYIGECVYAAWNGTGQVRRFLGRAFREAFRLRHVMQYAGVFFFLISAVLSNAGWMKNLRGTVNGGTDELENIVTMWHYPFYKLSELFVMNFAWILPVLAAAAIVQKTVFIKFSQAGLDKAGKNAGLNQAGKETDLNQAEQNAGLNQAGKNADLNQAGKETDLNKADLRKTGKEALFPLVFSFAAFLGISIGYFTYVHYRYMQPGIFFYVLLLGRVSCMIFKKEAARHWALLAAAVLFLSQSYITWDPVTYLLYPNVETGRGTVVSTRRYFYGGENYGYAYIEGDDELLSEHYQSEGMEYNREQLLRQNMLEQAFSGIGYGNGDLIVLDMFGGWKENTCYQLFGHSYPVYWDEDKKTVSSEQGDCEIQFMIAAQEIDLNSFHHVYYFKFPYNPYRKDDFTKEHEVIRQWEFTEGRWSMEVYQVK